MKTLVVIAAVVFMIATHVRLGIAETEITALKAEIHADAP